MSRRVAALAALGLLFAALAAMAGSAAASAGPCKGKRPAALRFSRGLGKTVGVLRWRGPAHRRMRFRVLRDRAVVGQTSRHAMRVAVTPGRRHRFAVVPLAPGGRATHCSLVRTVRVRYRVPGAPRNLAVGGDERALKLTWRPGRRGDGAPAGYRLLRDGATLGQTSRPSWQLRVAPNRRYRFAVVAVDRAGHVSRPSASVTVLAGHRAPSAPQGIEAIPVSESELGVSWRPSEVGAGRIAGYRVLRDGAVVKQVQGTSLVIGNLAPSTDYRVSVVAVDSLGYASAPSRVVSARTEDPVPTSGHAHAYLLASTDQSFEDFRAHYRQIGVVYPTYYDCTSSLELYGRDDPLVTRWTLARKVKLMPRINCQRTSVIHSILTDPPTRARWLGELTQLAATYGYDGISIDFEAGAASDRAAMTSFIEELASRLHADGRLLTIAVSPKAKDSKTHPRSGIFDYPPLSAAADWVVVMAWGVHWSTSTPGAQDDVAWTTGIADYVATMPNPRTFVYATNLYAMDWPDGGGPTHTATAYQYLDIVPHFPELGASTALDGTTDSYHATYADAGGSPHDVWYPAADTIGRRIRLAASHGFGGVGFWRLGREDQRLWDDPLIAPGASW